MKRLLPALFAAIFLCACVYTGPATSKQNSASIQKSRAKRAFDELDGKVPQKKPLSSPSKKPSKAPLKAAFSRTTHLLAKGYGQSRPEAIRQAKAELANIFESQIQSDVSSVTQSVTDSQKGDSLKKMVLAKVRIVSSVALEGVEMGEVKRQDGEYVAEAGLNRNRAASAWKREVARIDARILVETEKERKSKGRLMKLRHINNALGLFVEKEVYVSRLRVIGRKAPENTVMDFQELAALRQKLRSSFRIALDIQNPKADRLGNQLAKKLTEAGFLIESRPGESDATLKVRLGLSKVNNNNPNFKFMRATANITIVDPATGKKVGHLNESQRGAHLNSAEAEVKAVKKLSGTLSRKILAYFN